MYPDFINQIIEQAIEDGKAKLIQSQAQRDVQLNVCAAPFSDSYSLDWLVAFDQQEKQKEAAVKA